MRIALDYDFTYVLDPEYWDMFIEDARARSHEVIVVSSSRVSDGTKILTDLNGKVDRIVFTSGAKKRAYMTYVAGIHIDVWIDAQPDSV